MIKLSEVEGYCTRATAGPWGYIKENEDCHSGIWSEEEGSVLVNNGRSSGIPSEEDMAFCAKSRSDLPEAVRLLREAMEVIDVLATIYPQIGSLAKVKALTAEVSE